MISYRISAKLIVKGSSFFFARLLTSISEQPMNPKEGKNIYTSNKIILNTIVYSSYI